MDSPKTKSVNPILASVGEGALVCSRKGFKDYPRLLLTCEEIIGLLQEKLHLRFKNVRDSYNFYNTLNSDSGIQEIEFRDMIVCLGFDMSEEEYKKLWRYFDRDCDGVISYYEWNNVVGKVILPLSDISLSRPESPNRVKEWTRRAMARGLNDLLREESEHGSKDPVGDAFREVNSCRSGFISHEEFIQLCKKLKVPYSDDEETFCMFKKFQDKKSNSSGQLTLPEFRKFVEYYLSIPKNLLKKVTEEEQLAPKSIDQLEEMFTKKIVTKYSTVQRAWRSMDQDRDNSLSVPEFKKAFVDMNMPLSDAIYSAVLKRFDPEGKGYVTYNNFSDIVGNIIHPNAKDTSRAMMKMEEESGAQDGLYFVPTARLGTNAIDSVREARKKLKESVKLGEYAAPMLPPMDSFPDTISGFRSPKKTVSTSSISNEDAFPTSEPSSTVRLSTLEEIPTTKPLPPVDVGKVEERMRKLLGRGWVHAAADIKKAAGKGKTVSSDTLRDVLADKGVPLTAREANALAQKYGAPGGVNVDGLLSQAFKASFAGASVPATATLKSTTSAIAASAKALASKTSAPSAFSKNSIF